MREPYPTFVLMLATALLLAALAVWAWIYWTPEMGIAIVLSWSVEWLRQWSETRWDRWLNSGREA